MYTLTTLFLDDGEFALYINGHYLGSQDLPGMSARRASAHRRRSRRRSRYPT